MHKTPGPEMLNKRHSRIDRRCGHDRRRVHNLDYFLKGGIERRTWKERRSNLERRRGWLRVEDWYSVLVYQ